jgi:hypothetical protein
MGSLVFILKDKLSRDKKLNGKLLVHLLRGNRSKNQSKKLARTPGLLSNRQ